MQPPPNRDFIGVYEGALDRQTCQDIIEQFEASDEQRPGVTGGGVQPALKHTTDITISASPAWRKVQEQVAKLTMARLADYVREYPTLLAGGVQLRLPDPRTGSVLIVDAPLIAQLNDQNLQALTSMVYRLGTINCQRYAKAEGHYNHWHFEHHPTQGASGADALHRVLLFMYYLNDVEEGGETEFFYFERTLRPRAGTLVFAPAGFSHTHRGVAPRSNDKYILTSWVCFRPAEQLYANQPRQQGAKNKQRKNKNRHSRK